MGAAWCHLLGWEPWKRNKFGGVRTWVLFWHPVKREDAYDGISQTEAIKEAGVKSQEALNAILTMFSLYSRQWLQWCRGTHMGFWFRWCSCHIQCVCFLSFLIYRMGFKMGLPWWRSGWESACQCRGHGFKPWSGKIPHAEEQLGLWATTTEPACLEPVLRNKRGRDSERPVHRDEEWPPLPATRESPRTETKTQHSQK